MTRTLVLAAAIASLTLPAFALAQSGAQTGAAPMSDAQMLSGASVTLTQAAQAALKAVPGTLSEVSFDTDYGQGVFNATVVSSDGHETEVAIDAATGRILRTRANNDRYGDGMADAKALAGAPVTLHQAAQAALKAAPGTLSEIGFDTDYGKGVYKATVVSSAGQETEVAIDAGTGKILRTRADHDRYGDDG